MIYRNYLIHPDFEVRQKIRMIGGMPDLRQFDRIFISCSGGKDSQAMSYIIAELADKQNYDKSKIELVYADTGLEWHDTYKHVQAIGAALGIKTVQVLPKYKLLDNIRRRWEMFKNGTKNAEREREDTSHLAARTEAWQVRSRITPSDSAIQTTNEHQSANLSVPVSTVYVLPKSRKTVSAGRDYPNVGRGEISLTDLFPASLQGSVHHWESKSQCSNTANPFPCAHRRFCTGEGKNNQIAKLVRTSDTEGG